MVQPTAAMKKIIKAIREDKKYKEAKEEPAMRDDGGKLKWHLVPYPFLLELVKVFHGGALKYFDEAWRKGMSYSRIYRSMESHYAKWMCSTSSYDKELGTHHLAMVAWGCCVLYMYEVVFKFDKFDDRPDKGTLHDAAFDYMDAGESLPSVPEEARTSPPPRTFIK